LLDGAVALLVSNEHFMGLRLKLAVVCSVAVVIPLLMGAIFIFRQVSSRLREQSIQRLQAQSSAAMSLYDKRLAQMQSAAETLADEIGGKSLLGTDGSAAAQTQSRAKLQDLLSGERDRLSLDFLIVSDPVGLVIARHNDSPSDREAVTAPGKSNPVVDAVLAEGRRLDRTPTAACAVEQAEFLSRMWLDKAAKVEGSQLDQALLIEVGAPIISSGQFLGIVFAGQMLNNYYVRRPGSGDLQTPLVAGIRHDLFSDSDDSGSVMALGSTIIASSICRSGAGEPILRGSKCDPSRRFETITDAIGSYAVCWRPITSLEGGGIAAIGVAVPLDRLTDGSTTVLLVLVVTAMFGAILAGLAGFAFGEMMSARLKALTDAVSRMSLGELSTEVQDRPGPSGRNGLLSRLSVMTALKRNPNSSGDGRQSALQNGSDEIGVLAEHLEQLRASFRMAVERLRRR
jgi:hypothetical protein